MDSVSIGEPQAVLSKVQRFANEIVAPLVERPELVLPAADVESLIGTATEAGLIGAGADAPGLWDDPPHGPDALRALAQVNGGIAFGVHRAALAARLRARLELPGETATTALSLTGHYGLGRDALPRLLAGYPPALDDAALLADYFDLEGHARIVVGAGWQSLMAVEYDGAQLVWRELARSECAVEPQPHSHGFDELETATVRREVAAASDGVADTAAYVEALYLDALGMTAIAAGIVDHGLRLARTFAAERRQGGALIEAFPAVQQMLAQISATARAGSQHLAWFSPRDPGLEALTDLYAVRSAFHPACCVAANNAIQVLGGRGYMQDFGPEKLARDANTLRVLAGTPVELQLFVAEMERAS